MTAGEHARTSLIQNLWICMNLWNKSRKGGGVDVTLFEHYFSMRKNGIKTQNLNSEEGGRKQAELIKLSIQTIQVWLGFFLEYIVRIFFISSVYLEDIFHSVDSHDVRALLSRFRQHLIPYRRSRHHDVDANGSGVEDLGSEQVVNRIVYGG